VALVPYSGASFFPHAFTAYDNDEKETLKKSVKNRRLEGFCDITSILQPDHVIPAAGSYVMGGRIAEYSQHLHGATPKELADVWKVHGCSSTQLCVMSTGDVLDTVAGKITPNNDSSYRDFSEADRTAYALTLQDRTLPQDELVIPDGFPLPWKRLMEKARRNQWTMQERLGLHPEVDVEIKILETAGVKLSEDDAFIYRYSLDTPKANPKACLNGRPNVRFQLDASMALMVLLNAAVWNNVEIAALVECERTPDVHNPTVHSLMSFFTL